MADVINLRVHVAPVGFEVDRIVIPAIERRADRVWLMLPEAPGPVERFAAAIKAKLAERSIEVAEIVHDRSDPFDIMRATQHIIHAEQDNTVFVNLSSGSKIQAVGCMLACMMFNTEGNVHSYYVEPKRYRENVDEPLSEGVQDITMMPRYDIRLPGRMLRRALHIINERELLSKKELLQALLEEGWFIIYTDRSEKPEGDGGGAVMVQATPGLETTFGLTRLNNKVIVPLQKWGFIEVKKTGRSHIVSLTEQGKNAAKFLPKL